MLIHTDQLWSYLINEPPAIIAEAKRLLTFVRYNFDKKQEEYDIYWQEVFDWNEYTVIRFPTGMCKRLLDRLPIQEEIKKDTSRYTYITEDVQKVAEEVKQINPKFEIRDYQIKAALTALNNFNCIVQSSTGSGKEQPCDIVIPTPNGFKKFGDLKIGDEVFGKDGKSQKVTGIYPQGIKDVYKVYFQNGATVECGLDHLWTVKRNYGAYRTLTLREILKDYIQTNKQKHNVYIYSVDYINPVKYEERKFFIHPYILGVLIGDGTLTTCRMGFSCSDLDIQVKENVQKLLHEDYHLCVSRTSSCPQYYIALNDLHSHKNEYKSEITRLDLNKQSHEKFIPEEYLLGSVEQRKQLLAGLLDTDGCCRKRSKHCSITYGTVSKKLAEDIQQLVLSLGGSARIRSYTRKNRRTEYEVHIQVLFNPFNLNRKGNNYIAYRRNNTITHIEKVRKSECMCIKVSNEDELYVTQNYILTHNTSVISMICKILKDDKILITNGNNIILQQIYDRLVSFGITDIGWNPSEEPDYDKQIVLINTATSDSRLNSQDKKYIEFLKTVNTWCIDECFSGDTEVLTSEGYKRFDELNGEELFANFKADTQEIYFTKGKLLIKTPTSPCLCWKTHYSANVILTAKHQQLYYDTKTKEIKKDEIQNINFTNKNNKIFCSGHGIGKKEHLTNLDKILIALQADGCATQKANRHCYHIGFLKERKIKYWEQLLKDFSGKVTQLKSQFRHNKETKCWHIWLPEYPNAKAKNLYDCFDLKDFSYTAAQEFIEEILKWDGWKQSLNVWGYVCKDKKNTDFIAAVASLAGYEAYQQHGTDKRENYSDYYRIFLRKRELKSLQNCKRKKIKTLDKVYCVEVPEHNIIVRNGGDMQYSFISGNCQHFQTITGFEPVFYMDEEKLKRIVGFSATPFRRYDAPYDNDQDFRLIALLGEPKFKYEMQDTIADNNIAQPYGYFIRYKNYTPNLPDKFKKDYFMQYRMGITYNKARNTAGLAMLKYLSEHNVITLACVNKIKNGQKIIEELTKQGIKCKMICGNQHGRIGSTIFEYKPNKRGTLKLEETDGTIEDLEKAFDEGYNIIVGTSVLQEGADIQRFQAVVLFNGAKDYIGSTQMIGRAVRKKKTGKNIAFVIDFNDHGGLPILSNHCSIRRAAMEKNGVKIIEKVGDFCKMIDDLDKP